MLHGHTPWIVILVRKVEEWKETHGGAMPDGKQRGEFKTRWESSLFSLSSPFRVLCRTGRKQKEDFQRRWHFLFFFNGLSRMLPPFR